MKVQDRTPERLGPYRLIRRLGEGGMGVVYLANDATGRPVAVKALRPGMAAEENVRRRLAREVETMRRVRSRYVAEVVDADVSSEPPYIVTRFVPGLTLDAIVGEAGPLGGAELGRLACGLAEALAAVHTGGVVHRDLKPGNVMISDGEPVVIDFGIAQLPETTRLTMTGMFMGTPGYLAPEVIEGKDSGSASDVHSLGATLAFAAIGRPPFGTGTFEAIFFRIMHGQPDLDTLPEPLLPMIRRTLSRDPAARPTAAELCRWAASLDPATLVPSPPGRASLTAPQLGEPNWPAPVNTVSDDAGRPAWPHSTRPLTTWGTGDLRDLLPPVNYRTEGEPAGAAAAYLAAGPAGTAIAWPAGAAAGQPGTAPAVGGLAGSAGVLGVPGGGAGPFAGGPGYSGWPGPDGGPVGPDGSLHGSASRVSKPVSSWSPLVLGTVAVAVAGSVLAPVIGTAVSLAALIGLRAAGIIFGRRRSGDGLRPVTALARVAYFPVAVLRSLLTLVLLAPVALVAFAVAAAATILAVPVHPLPLAIAFGAGALVAVVGVGPGSSGGRATLARFFGAVGRTPSRMAVAYAGVLAVAVWASAAAATQHAAFWPINNPHVQLMHMPAIRSVLHDARVSLLRLARRFGL